MGAGSGGEAGSVAHETLLAGLARERCHPRLPSLHARAWHTRK